MRFVTEKHQELIVILDELVIALVGENIENKKDKGKLALVKANNLRLQFQNKIHLSGYLA